jgi:SAM-dependent methyltransferase
MDEGVPTEDKKQPGRGKASAPATPPKGAKPKAAKQTRDAGNASKPRTGRIGPRLPVRRERNSIFFDAYDGVPPWDIGRAQPAFVELANLGQVEGSVLDLGCGTGDLVLEMAERGHEAWGVDMVPRAIDQAKAKARLRGLDQESAFLVGDALEIEHLNRTFGTVLDCGLFHTFSDPERELYEQQLRKVTRPGSRLHIMAMSDWEDPAWGGPRRVTQAELMDTFREGWRLDDIVEARFLVLPGYNVRAHAWLATFIREDDPVRGAAKRSTPNKPRKKAAPTPPPTGDGGSGKLVETVL